MTKKLCDIAEFISLQVLTLCMLYSTMAHMAHPHLLQDAPGVPLIDSINALMMSCNLLWSIQQMLSLIFLNRGLESDNTI